MTVVLTAWVPRHINTDDLRITDLRLRIEHACVKRQNSGRPRGAAALLRLYPHQYPWGKSCTLTVSLLLGFAEAAHDSAVMNPISNRTVVCRLRESPPRARCRCTSHHFHCMYPYSACIHTSILPWRVARQGCSNVRDDRSPLTRFLHVKGDRSPLP